LEDEGPCCKRKRFMLSALVDYPLWINELRSRSQITYQNSSVISAVIHRVVSDPQSCMLLIEKMNICIGVLGDGCEVTIDLN
jgi:hypothetical protein